LGGVPTLFFSLLQRFDIYMLDHERVDVPRDSQAKSNSLRCTVSKLMWLIMKWKIYIYIPALGMVLSRVEECQNIDNAII
jgi:hypothetical protein